MKKCVRYLRFSSTGQSKCSIELQNINTLSWCNYNNTEVLETFEDKGRSAATFDRPNFKELELFIKKWHKVVDYLLVNSFDRFSRDAGEAIMRIKQYCTKYNIRIVSASENVIYDPEDVSSFWNVALAFIRAEDEIIRHKKRVNGGIYASKKEERRYIGSIAPFGYKKILIDKKTNITIDQVPAAIVGKLIDSFYYQNTPLPILREQAKELGIKMLNKHSVRRILSNPVYYGLQILKAYGSLPGGIIPGKWEAIRPADWYYTIKQRLDAKDKKQRFKLNEDFPLRGIVKCAADCGKNLTAGFSKGKYNLFGYYFCTTHRKENYSSARMHDQMLQLMELLSIPENFISYIIKIASAEFERLNGTNLLKVKEAKKQLEVLHINQDNLETQFLITRSINENTYQRQNNKLQREIIELNATINASGPDKSQMIYLFKSETPKLSNLKFIYENATIANKQQLINLVFESGLYYSKNIYRTPSLLQIFSHNYLQIKGQNLLIVDQLEQKLPVNDNSAPPLPPFELLTPLLTFLSQLKSA